MPNIQNADKQQYLQDLMDKYKSGIGIGENMYGTGANAANQFGQNAMNQGQNSAQMQYNQKNAQGNLFGNILGTGASIGAGAAFGPMGYYGVNQAMNGSGFNPYGQGR